MRFVRLVLGLSLLTTLAVHAPEAHAGKKGAPAGQEDAAAKYPKIEMTGVAQFDDVFGKAKTIQDTLDTQKTELVTARTNLNSALGVAADAPVKTALEDLKTKAEGKLKVVMNGTTPKLEAADGVPDNVKAAIDAANGMLTACGNTVAAGKDLTGQATELIGAAKDFPNQVGSVVTGDPIAAAKSLKLVTGNLKAMATTPERIKALGDEAMLIINDVKAVFGG